MPEHSGFESERTFLAGLPDRVIAKVHRLGRSRRFREGMQIHRAGDAASSLELIRSGAVHLSRTDQAGRRIVLSRHEAGDTIGLFTVLTGRPRAYDAEAATPVELSLLSRRDLEQLIADEPLIRTRVIHLLSDRLSRTLEALEDERRLPLAARLAKRLLDHAGEDGKVSLTQERLAEELGVSRYAVTLALRAFQSRGLVRTSYGALFVLDGAGLTAAGNGAPL